MITSRWYNEDDFTCNCGCGQSEVQQELADMLDDMCDAVGNKLEVSCTYRCPIHNLEVGGVENSQHTQGTAADVLCPDIYTVDELAEIAIQCGADGVGRYYGDGFVHCDVRNGRIGSDIEWTDEDY